MPVIIKKRTVPLAPVKVEEMPPFPSEVTSLPVKKSGTNTPSGRGYLRKGYKRPEVFTENPRKTLEQILPRVYNTPKENSGGSNKEVSNKDFEDSDLAYYSPYRCLDCKDTKKILVYDTCEVCDGKGCRKCNNTGEIKNHIPCQSCNRIVVRY